VRVSQVETAVTRHDVSLFVIGCLFAVAVLAGSLSSVEQTRALATAAVLSTGCLGYVLFYRPPEQ
jgi:hypothetical protein